MGKIQKLPEPLIRLIAAGEVIERPASVLKELVENSLDAGATRLAIDIWGAGRTRIRVADNGEGMMPEDAELAFVRHATSKLRELADLQAIASFGFRGEALPSIAAVSRLTLTTRTAEAAHAWTLKLDAGRLLAAEAAGAPVGTTIDVQDLFFNTPARHKFLKRDGTERAHLLKVIQELSLTHPETHVDVAFDDKPLMHLAPADLRTRLGQFWGAELCRPLLEFRAQHPNARVHGLVNALPNHHVSKSYQLIFVNGRPVQHRVVTRAVYEAYHEWLPVGRHPTFVLFIEVDPGTLDVNVHPSKREVRLADERGLFDFLYRHLRERHRVSSDGTNGFRSSFAASAWTHERPSVHPQDGLAALMAQAPSVNESLAAVDRVAEPVLPGWMPELQTQSALPSSDARFLGIFQKLFIVMEDGSDFVIVDQHAAAERILYERFLRQARQPESARHRLLTPILWELPPDRSETLSAALQDLNALGFTIEPFGSHSYALKEWPSGLPSIGDAQQFLDVFLASLEEEAAAPDEASHHEAVARAACRAAIKANDTIADSEVRGLLRDLSVCERPMTCPHGRPTAIRLSRQELFRRFGRT